MIKNLYANARDTGLISGPGWSLREGNGNPLQYSCLENLMNREGWQATVCGVTKHWTQLSDWAHGTCFLIRSTALGKAWSQFFPVKVLESVRIFQSIYYLPLILALNTVTFDYGQRIRCGFTQCSWIMTTSLHHTSKYCVLIYVSNAYALMGNLRCYHSLLNVLVSLLGMFDNSHCLNFHLFESQWRKKSSQVFILSSSSKFLLIWIIYSSVEICFPYTFQ